MHYSEEIKTHIIARYKSKECIISISNETGIPRSTIYRWINDYTAKNSINSNAKNKVNQQFQTTRPNEVWVSDVTYFRAPFNNAEPLINKGIKEKPIEMSYRKGSDFNRFFRWLPLSGSN